MDSGSIREAASMRLTEARFSPALRGASQSAEAGGGRGRFSAVLDAALEEGAREKDPRRVPAKPLIDKTDKLYEQCEALETFLIKNLLSSMRNTVDKSGFIDDGFAGRMYEDMLYDEYAKTYAQNAAFGLAELAYLELSGQRGTARPR
ncbi:MAG: rod-binding protein [Spirochaetaceae bacterium]|jgi:flagellar protein FlgJ|nr:rod-binding protein [Spirochaetaceae bacterium]